MKRVAIGLLCAVGGYIIAALVGYFLVDWFSANVHDRSVEAAMTSAFVFGPFGAVVSFVVGFVLGGRPAASASSKS